MSNALTTHDASLTGCLEDWAPDKASWAKDVVLELADSTAWPLIQEVIGLEVERLYSTLHNMKPFETTAEYEAVLGQIKGLQGVEQLLNGVIEKGEEAENELATELRAVG